jgi:Helix-turn-helix domain
MLPQMIRTAGVDQAEAGARAGKDACFIRRMERVRGVLEYRDVIRLLAVYGASPADLPQFHLGHVDQQ